MPSSTGKVTIPGHQNGSGTRIVHHVNSCVHKLEGYTCDKTGCISIYSVSTSIVASHLYLFWSKVMLDHLLFFFQVYI